MADQVNSNANSNKTILVCEDDVFYANIYKTRLSAAGYQVESANNGDDAIKMIARRKPDLLLLDLIMPTKDGFQVLEELRKNPTTKDLKIIVFSNLGQEEDIKRAKNFNVLNYFVKTDISISELVKVVADALAS